MRKITVHFLDGQTSIVENDVDLNLIENIKSFYENLKIEKLNNNEFKLSGLEEHYQIFNIEKKQLYNLTQQGTVFMVTIDLEKDEFEYILETIENKKNDSNN